MRGDDGLGLIETVLAMALAVGVLLGVSGTLVRGLQNASGHERQVSAYAIAADELERVRVLARSSGFDGVALSAPHTVTAAAGARVPQDPTAWLTDGGTRFAVRRSWHDTTSAAVPVAPAGEPVLVGGSALAPGPGRLAPVSDVAAGGTRARVWRFVTAVCPPSAPGCDAEVRRVTVAVRLASRGGPDQDALELRAPVYLSTLLATPTPAAAPGTASGIYVGLDLP